MRTIDKEALIKTLTDYMQGRDIGPRRATDIAPVLHIIKEFPTKERYTLREAARLLYDKWKEEATNEFGLIVLIENIADGIE